MVSTCMSYWSCISRNHISKKTTQRVLVILKKGFCYCGWKPFWCVQFVCGCVWDGRTSLWWLVFRGLNIRCVLAGAGVTVSPKKMNKGIFVLSITNVIILRLVSVRDTEKPYYSQSSFPLYGWCDQVLTNMLKYLINKILEGPMELTSTKDFPTYIKGKLIINLLRDCLSHLKI